MSRLEADRRYRAFIRDVAKVGEEGEPDPAAMEALREAEEDVSADRMATRWELNTPTEY